MDPKILPEQPGWSPDSSKDEHGVNYLRQLKAQVAGAAPHNTAVTGDRNTPAARAATDWKDRRRSPRLRCSGSAEFRAEGSDVRLWGTLTDISLHGCYVEMNVTFPIGTNVDLILKSCGVRIQVSGTVRTSYPFVGMGVCFAEVEPEQQKELNQLLSVLVGHNTFTYGVPAPEKALNDTQPSADPRGLLDEITEFFRKNSLLSRDEFHQIAKRVRRS